jgi:hypothetical protein
MFRKSAHLKQSQVTCLECRPWRNRGTSMARTRLFFLRIASSDQFRPRCDTTTMFFWQLRRWLRTARGSIAASEQTVSAASLEAISSRLIWCTSSKQNMSRSVISAALGGFVLMMVAVRFWPSESKMKTVPPVPEGDLSEQRVLPPKASGTLPTAPVEARPLPAALRALLDAGI